MNWLKTLKLPRLGSDASLNALKTAVAVILGLLICQFFHIQNTLWIVLTILVVMGSHYHVGSAIRNAFFRIVGTLFGAVIALLTLWWIPSKDANIYMLIVFFSVLGFSYLACSKSKLKEVGVLGALTVVTVLMSTEASPKLAFIRVGEISLGVLIALLISKLLFPIHSRVAFLDKVIDTLANYIDIYDKLYACTSMAEKQACLQKAEQAIVDNFSEQKTLIKESKTEFGYIPFNKAMAESMLNYEYRLYRSIVFLSQAVNKEPAHFEQLIAISGFDALNESIIFSLRNLMASLKGKAGVNKTIHLNDLLKQFEDNVAEEKQKEDVPLVQLDAMVFCLRHIVDEVSVLQMLIDNYKQS